MKFLNEGDKNSLCMNVCMCVCVCVCACACMRACACVCVFEHLLCLFIHIMTFDKPGNISY